MVGQVWRLAERVRRPGEALEMQNTSMFLTVLAVLSALNPAHSVTVSITGAAPATMTVRRGSRVLWTAKTQGLSCVTSSEVSPDEHYILNIADGCGYVQLWNMRTGQRVQTYLARYYQGLFATFTPDSRRVVLSFGEGKNQYGNRIASLWSIEGKNLINILDAPNAESFRAVHFSADGQYMIFTDGYNPASVFNAVSGAYKQTLPHYLGSGANDARLSSDGRLALVLYQNNAEVIYQVASGKMLKLLRPGLGRNVGLPDPIDNLDWY
jgi:WD40 repeat protein